MTQRSNIINVVGDVEHFLDSLLSHVEEDNCTHTIMDFLDEYFDKKNGEGPTPSLTYTSTVYQREQPTPTDKEGGELS